MARIVKSFVVLPMLWAILLLSVYPYSSDQLALASQPDDGMRLTGHGATSLEISYKLGTYNISQTAIQGQSYHSISIPGVHLPGNSGEPNLPRVARYIALPRGAIATIRVTGQKSQSIEGIEIAPAPDVALDGSRTKYQKKSSIFEHDDLYPPAVALLSSKRSMRGVDTAILSIAPFQYNPVTKELLINTDLEITIEFEGGSEQFGDDRLRSRYWEPILSGQLLNYVSLPRIDFTERHRDGGYGFEHVIITNDHPDFITWGLTLRDWRRLQGISCELFTSSDIGGHQATYIEDFLTDAYQTWDVPPVAFTLLGDYVDPGDPNHGVTALFWNGYSVSDNLLADIEGDDYLPDIIPGRIMAKNNDQLAATVGKMIDYESNPPLSSVFYNRPLVTGGWATDRWYTLLSETIYGFQENELGKSPERIYTLYDGSPGSLWSTADNTQMLVDYFGPAGLGYIPLDPSYLSDWTGSAALINDRINAGSYFVLHRDHGTEMTWVSPQYQIFDINALTNTEYPFVFSINCSSGKFNWPDCFTEFFCSRDGYGALGGLASAEISFSFCNDTYLFGVFDGLWPEFDPAYPGGLPDLDPPGGTELRTAFANAAGKYYLAASDWPNNPLRKLYTINLFHHFGDAFMQLYSEVPLDLTVDHASSCYIDDTSFSVSANPGALIALTYEGEIIGLSDGTGAPVDIPLSQPIDLGELRITITLPNYIRYDETVPIMPVPLLIQADGSGDAPTIQAAIELATSGGTIELGDGEYSGSGNRDISLMEKDLIIRSAGGDPALCIINCEGSDGDPHRGFSFSAADGPNVVISDLTIRGGWADQGGAIYCDSASAPVIIGCVIDSSFALRGGGLFCRKAGPLLSENTFAANSASDAGGGAYLNNTAPDTLLRGCTFVMNSAPTGSGLHGVDCTDLIQYSIFAFNEVGNAISCDNSSFELECCDMFGNQSGDWVGCVADIYPRFDNLNTDPCFCSLETGDYRLCDDSACLGSECGQIGAWPAGCAGSQDAVVLPPTEEPADFAFSIRANLPNPFTSMTRIAYTVPGNLGERKPVRVTIHDISGRLVRTLLSDNQSSGEHNITWDGNDLHGQPATTGIYACRIQIERGYLNRRLTLFR